jgi:hypothetical protein
MSTSPLGGRLLTGYGLDSYKAIGASVARDFATNNLLHYADEFAQVRSAWSTTVAAFTGQNAYLTGPDDGDADVWYPIIASPPFPIPLREDGRSYRMRVRIGGSSDGGELVQFRLVLAPQREALILVNAVNEDFIFETDATDVTTPAWLTGESQGAQALTTQVQIPAAYASSWMVETSTIADVGGAAVTASQCLVSLCIFGRSVNNPDFPRLEGLYAGEFIGD